MAETAITPTQVSFDSGFALSQGAGTAINASNTMAIPYPQHGKLLIVIDSDHADTAATVEVSEFGVAKGLGTQELAVGNAAQKGFIISDDRHKQADGNVVLSWAANSAGYLYAYYLP